jgi:hypothetical protein
LEEPNVFGGGEEVDKEFWDFSTIHK